MTIEFHNKTHGLVIGLLLQKKVTRLESGWVTMAPLYKKSNKFSIVYLIGKWFAVISVSFVMEHYRSYN